MRNKIIGMSTIITLLAILCAQSAIAQPSISVYVWTNKPQYEPGEKGTLKISILNEGDEPVEIRNFTIVYPWFAYDADEGKWVGNETIKLEPAEILVSNGGKYYKPVEFTIPSDGRATMENNEVTISIGTSKGIVTVLPKPELYISSVSLPMTIVAFDTWMTSLIVAVVVCTIILAIVIFLATRGPRTPGGLIPRAAVPPPPPKPKAKA